MSQDTEAAPGATPPVTHVLVWWEGCPAGTTLILPGLSSWAMNLIDLMNRDRLQALSRWIISNEVREEDEINVFCKKMSASTLYTTKETG